MESVKELYEKLLSIYGPQGWWPLLDCRLDDSDKEKSRLEYHPEDYDFPRTDRQRFEICVGAILTQNTAWLNVEKALIRLRRADILKPEAILNCESDLLIEAIRPSGYFNIKARKLREFSRLYLDFAGRIPERGELLAAWGVGPETADSILLYACFQPVMVVDAYTRRVLERLNLYPATAASYDEVKQFCESGLPRELAVYQEFHALLVAHAKTLK